MANAIIEGKQGESFEQVLSEDSENTAEDAEQEQQKIKIKRIFLKVEMKKN